MEEETKAAGSVPPTPAYSTPPRKRRPVVLVVVGIVVLLVITLISSIVIAAVVLPYNTGLFKAISRIPHIDKLFLSDEKKGRMAVDKFWTNIKDEETRKKWAEDIQRAEEVTLSVKSEDFPKVGDVNISLSGSMITAKEIWSLKLKLNGNIGKVNIDNIKVDLITTKDFLYVRINNIPDNILEFVLEGIPEQLKKQYKACVDDLKGQWIKIELPKETPSDSGEYSMSIATEGMSCFTDENKIEKVIEELEKDFGADDGEFIEIKKVGGEDVYVFGYLVDFDKIKSLLERIAGICGEESENINITEEEFPFEFKKVQLGVDNNGQPRYLAIEVDIDSDGQKISVGLEGTNTEFNKAQSVTVPEGAKDWEDVSSCLQ